MGAVLFYNVGKYPVRLNNSVLLVIKDWVIWTI